MKMKELRESDSESDASESQLTRDVTRIFQHLGPSISAYTELETIDTSKSFRLFVVHRISKRAGIKQTRYRISQKTRGPRQRQTSYTFSGSLTRRMTRGSFLSSADTLVSSPESGMSPFFPKSKLCKLSATVSTDSEFDNGGSSFFKELPPLSFERRTCGEALSVAALLAGFLSRSVIEDGGSIGMAFEADVVKTVSMDWKIDIVRSIHGSEGPV